MYKNLLETASAQGAVEFIVEALIKNKNQVLLVEDPLLRQFVLPSTELKKEETLGQALQRLTVEKTSMNLREIKAFFGHYDTGERSHTRHFQFIIEVSDPYAIDLRGYTAYAWVNAEDGVGYPISDDLRKQLDTFKLFTE